jgi:hypothetical protein
MRALALPVALAVITGASACPAGPGVSGTVQVAPPGRPSVELTYLGVGGWIMRRGDTEILAAPLFSNPSFVRTGLAPIHSDTVAVDRYMGRYDVSDAAAILVGHGHYDHLMDVPRVAKKHAPRATILGSSTVKNLLGTWSGVADRVVVVDSLAGDRNHAGRWIRVAQGVRVMPLESHHAPHFEGYTLYSGTADVPRTEEPGTAEDWVDGPTYAFLVDFLDPDGSVAFRVYYQDAVPAPPLGQAPEAVVAERPVDVAIIVPATFDQVDWHPEALLENLRPRWALLGHWENFFIPPDAETTSITLTDIHHFEDRMDRYMRGRFWRPDLFTVFRFPVTGSGEGGGVGRAGMREGSGSL